MNSVLATTEWQAFTQQYWRVEPVRLDYAPRGPGGPRLQAICYADRRGRLMLPPYQPHLPLQFTPTPTDAPYRIERQWLETARMLVDDVMARGMRGELTFPSVMTDPRPWLWSHFRVTPRFTNFLDFPFDLGRADRVIRQHAQKAAREGFTCRLTDRLEDVMTCLSGSEGRKRFSYGMTLDGLRLGRQVVGPEMFRTYVAYTPEGQPAAARVVLHRPEGRACDWLAGTLDAHLRSGATQLLMTYMLDDLQQAGAIGYNSCGADLETVAMTKTLWGGRLMTQYSILAYDLQPVKSFFGNMLRFWRQQRAARRARRKAQQQIADGESGAGCQPANNQGRLAICPTSVSNPQ